jgi:Tfp pilus assembly protein PilZ
MTEGDLEKRICVRFRIPGATVRFKREKGVFKKGKYIGEFLPVMDISRGGIRFLAQELLKYESKVVLKISIPGETTPLIFKGAVRWFSPNPGKSYKYQMGVQFNPYGEKKDQNYPGNLVKIIALEQKFLDESTLPEEGKDKDKSEFSI